MLNSMGFIIEELRNCEKIAMSGDIKRIASYNSVFFSPYTDELEFLSFDSVHEFLLKIKEEYIFKYGRGIFYCWFDVQAGQLRASYIPINSSPPFKRDIVMVVDIGVIINIAISEWRFSADSSFEENALSGLSVYIEEKS